MYVCMYLTHTNTLGKTLIVSDYMSGRFSIAFRKTKTKVITLANHKGRT